MLKGHISPDLPPPGLPVPLTDLVLSWIRLRLSPQLCQRKQQNAQAAGRITRKCTLEATEPFSGRNVIPCKCRSNTEVLLEKNGTGSHTEGSWRGSDEPNVHSCGSSCSDPLVGRCSISAAKFCAAPALGMN